MQSTEGSQPPPPIVPPPPGGSPMLKTDNPIALVGLMVSTLGLVLAVIVVGGFLGVAGIGLSVVGLRRSRALDGNGKALAFGGIVLGLIAIALSVLGFIWIRDLLDTTETTVIDGIRSATDDADHPPQNDVDGIECGASNTGLFAQATVSLTNRSDSDTRYTLTVEWDTDTGGTVQDTFTTESVDSGDSRTFSTLDLSGSAVIESCRVSQIDRLAFPFLP